MYLIKKLVILFVLLKIKLIRTYLNIYSVNVDTQSLSRLKSSIVKDLLEIDSLLRTHRAVDPPVTCHEDCTVFHV